MSKMIKFFAGRPAAALAVALLAGAAFMPLSAQAQVTLNLKDADINTLITTVSEVTGKNFIVDPRVKGKVTVVSASPMSSDALYATFLAVLQVQGFVAIPSGDVIKLEPETNARQDGGTGNIRGSSPDDEVVTHVYSIRNVSATQLVPILRPLVPQWAALAAYSPSNMLIIADRAANVRRIGDLIAQIDQSSDREIEMVQLKHASASEVVRTLTSLTQGESKGSGGDATSQPGVVIADERSNSVLIGGDKSERQKLIDIINRLDIPVGEDGSTQVINLRYASAQNLAPILEGYAQQQQKQGSGSTGQAASTASRSSAGGVSDEVHVIADPDTNALIVTAPPKSMRQMRDVIAQLDIRRKQVLVEGIIAEISADRASQLGFDWAVYNGERIAAASILDPTTLSALTTAATADDPETAALSAISQGINLGGGSYGGSDGTSFALIMKALQGDGDTNVLASPTLVTMDNEEATFSAGQEVPFLSGSYANTGTSSSSGTVNPFQTVNREEVGLTLKITPQINTGDTIKLKIDLESSSLATAVSGAVDLVTNKRTLSNTVSVESGQILVLGGVLDDNLTESQNKIPLLGDIPLLGNLFKYRSVTRTKRNLMMFIRPAILTKKEDIDYYTRRKYDQVRDAQIGTSTKKVPLIGGSRPTLQPFDQFQDRGTPDTSAVPTDFSGNNKDGSSDDSDDATPETTPPKPLPPPPAVAPATSSDSTSSNTDTTDNSSSDSASATSP